MAEKRSVYLSDVSLGMPRRMDSLSGRINQALDRYARIIEIESMRLRAMFWDDEWLMIVDASRRWRDTPADQLPAAVREHIGVSVAGLTDAQLIVLADIAESDL